MLVHFSKPEVYKVTQQTHRVPRLTGVHMNLAGRNLGQQVRRRTKYSRSQDWRSISAKTLAQRTVELPIWRLRENVAFFNLMDQAPAKSDESPPRASKDDIRRARARENARRTRERKEREKVYTEARIQASLSDIELLKEARQRCVLFHQFQAFVANDQMLESLLQRRVQLDAQNAQVKRQFQDAIAGIDRFQRNFLVPPPRLSLELHPIRMLPPAAAVDFGTCFELVDLACEELAHFRSSSHVRTHFVSFRGWKTLVWNSGDCTVNVKSELSVHWNPEMAMNTTWEILKSPSRSHEILLDIPLGETMQVQQLISDDVVVVRRLVQPPKGFSSESLEPREFVSVLFRRHIGSMFLVGMKSIPVTECTGYSYHMDLRGQELRGWIFTTELEHSQTAVMAEVVSSVSVRCPYDTSILTGLANMAINNMIEWEHMMTRS